MTGCGCEAWRGSAGHQRATSAGQSERCFIHHIGQVIFALITPHLRSRPEGSVPPCSPVNTLRSLKHLYSPTLLRLLSRTLAGGVSTAWGVMGGGGEGRVAVRAFQWETQWEQLDPCPEAEWPLGTSDAAPCPAYGAAKRPEQRTYCATATITLRRSSSSSSASSSEDLDAPGGEEQRVGATGPAAAPRPEGARERWRDAAPTPSPSEPASPSSASSAFLHDSAPVQLAQVVVVAAERILALSPGHSLAESVMASPHRLIQHVMTAQKKHLKTK